MTTTTKTQTYDKPLVRELSLFATNEGDLYRTRFLPMVKNLARKEAAGRCDVEKAAKLFSCAAPDILASYNRQHAAPGQLKLNAAGRMALGHELLEYYGDAIRDTAQTLQKAARFRRVWTKAAIRQVVMQSGSHHFDAKTMKFFGETMANYRVEVTDEAVIYLHRSGGRAGYRRYIFNPETRTLDGSRNGAEG